MAVTTLQSNLVPFYLSADSGTTYEFGVCKKGWTFNHETSTTEEETDCGTLIGLGSNKWSADFEGVLNTTPASGEFGLEDVAGWATAQTQLLIKLTYPTSGGSAGGDLYYQGAGYITNFSVSNSVGSLITFSFTFKGTGTLDITA